MRSRVRVERGDTGRRYAVSREYDAPPAAAWRLLANTEHWATWGPSVSDVHPGDATVREGLTGEVQVVGGPWVPFEITDVSVDETAGVRRWAWSVARIPATGHRVERTETGCKVGFEVPLLAGGYVPVCQRALGDLAEALDGA
jgi:uncharacterized protein YndB with AHSA1/START domain